LATKNVGGAPAEPINATSVILCSCSASINQRVTERWGHDGQNKPGQWYHFPALAGLAVKWLGCRCMQAQPDGLEAGQSLGGGKGEVLQTLHRAHSVNNFFSCSVITSVKDLSIRHRRQQEHNAQRTTHNAQRTTHNAQGSHVGQANTSNNLRNLHTRWSDTVIIFPHGSDSTMMKSTALSSLFLIILTILPCQFHSVAFAADDEGENSRNAT
jgi:hypothetical protein